MDIILVLGIVVFLIMVHPTIFFILVAILLLPVIIGIVLSVMGVNIPSLPNLGFHARKGSYRRKSKSFVKMMIDGQSRTEKRNMSHRGVMSASRNVGARGGRRRR
jgi:hypothetical protein